MQSIWDTHTNSQFAADNLNRLIDSRKASDAEQREVKKGLYVTLQKFEQCDWHPAAFQEALDQAGCFGTEDGLLVHQEGCFEADKDGRLTYTGGDVWTAIASVLQHYINDVGGAAEEVFGTADAAEYLGLSIDAIKTHVHRLRDLHGEVKGKSLIFTRVELDRFKAAPRRPGPKTTK